MKDQSKNMESQRFNPELDGQGRVLSPVKKKYLPKSAAGEPALALAFRQALAKSGPDKTV